MMLLCWSWKGRKRHLFTEVHKTFINGKAMLATLGMVIQSHLHFFVWVQSSVCALSFSGPDMQFKAIQKCIGMFLRWGMGWQAELKILAGVNFFSDKVSYTIHIGSVVIQWNTEFKNLLHSCWLDLRPSHRSLLASPFIHTQKHKIYFPINTLVL